MSEARSRHFLKAKKKASEKPSHLSAFKKKLDEKRRESRGWAIGLTLAWAFLMCVWVAAVLYATQIVVALVSVFIFRDSEYVLQTTLFQLAYSAIVYVICLVVGIFLPWKVLKCKTTRDELGVRGLPTWTDILLAPVGFVLFMVIASILLAVMQAFLPGIDWEQSQEVGFDTLITSGDFICAFLSLVVIAPIAEEVLFRGWLYGKLRARMSAVPAILFVSVLFGIVHGQWNVGVTVFVMSIAMCCIRELTGTIWGGILIHMIKNGMAFYFLFVNPTVLTAML